MLTTTQLQEALTHISYKPGWEFKIYDGKHEGQHVVITTVVPDAYDPDKNVTLDVHTSIAPMRDVDQFYEWFLWRLKRLESHECREFYRVDGKVYDDPHAEYADRDL
jgi:hypothetical protein